jgi:hypothetical protein
LIKYTEKLPYNQINTITTLLRERTIARFFIEGGKESEKAFRYYLFYSSLSIRDRVRVVIAVREKKEGQL